MAGKKKMKAEQILLDVIQIKVILCLSSFYLLKLLSASAQISSI